MGFYIRKSVKAGPFRFNLSKSGLGVSAGIPGFRHLPGARGSTMVTSTAAVAVAPDTARRRPRQ